jgi:hypothetical protein
MKHISRYLFLILWMCCKITLAQKNTKVVLDAASRLPVDYVYISTEDRKLSAVTNKDGRFVFISSSKVNNYTFFKLGYIKQTLSLATLQKTDTIFLKLKPNFLDEVTVNAKVMDTVVRDKRFYIDDYLVLSNNDFLILTSKININGFELSFYNKEKGITHTKRVNKEKNPFLFTDIFNNIHLVTNDYSRQLLFNSDTSFDFLPKFTRKKFDSTLALTLLKLDSTILIKQELAKQKITVGRLDYDVPSPFLNIVQASKTSVRDFYTVLYNKDLLSMVQNETRDEKMVAKIYESYGVPQYGRGAFAANFYTNILIPIYVPLFLVNDTVVLFDFQEKEIVMLSKKGTLLKKVQMDKEAFNTMHHHEVLYDKGCKLFYFKTSDVNRSFLSRINIYEGTLSKKINLQKVFAQNLQVLNNRLYYLVKEHEWDDTRYLYQQNL